MISNKIYNETMKTLGVSPKKGLEYMKKKDTFIQKKSKGG